MTDRDESQLLMDVYRYFARRLPVDLLPHLGEELTGRTLRLLEAAAPESGLKLPRATIYAGAHSVLRDYMTPAAPSEVPSGRIGPDDPDLAAAWAQLSDLQREVLSLISWEELDHAEAALVLGMEEGEVARQSASARSHLNSFLEQVQGIDGS